MSDRRHIQKRHAFTAMCATKVRYSKREAQAAINRIMHGHRRNRPDTLRAYHCPFCDGWHLTKQDE
jgi:hypothetical protein